MPISWLWAIEHVRKKGASIAQMIYIKNVEVCGNWSGRRG